jgi:hypothetical protein
MPPNAQMRPGIRALSLAMLFIFMACAAFGIVTGVGLLRLKNWARISALVWSGITVFFAGFALLLSLIIPMPPPRNAPDFTMYFCPRHAISHLRAALRHRNLVANSFH